MAAAFDLDDAAEQTTRDKIFALRHDGARNFEVVMPEFNAPGVFVEEVSPTVPGIARARTGIPAFIGYTAHAGIGDANFTGAPTRIDSFFDFEERFGGPAPLRFVADAAGAPVVDRSARFVLHESVRLFFGNGGRRVWVVSVGGFTDSADATKPRAKLVEDFRTGVRNLKSRMEPDILALPDAAFLPDAVAWGRVSRFALRKCADRNRFAILDVREGDRPLVGPDDPVAGPVGMRAQVHDSGRSYGAAYYPWIDTFAHSAQSLSPLDFPIGLRANFAATAAADARSPAEISAVTRDLASADLSPERAANIHAELLDASPSYRRTMEAAAASANRLPASGALAGVMARVDEHRGFWKAPANEAVFDCAGLAVAVTAAEQDALNAPADGKAVNALREFPGRGVLVWGARTLDGADGEYRYVPVRRTAVMLRRSIAPALRALSTGANDATTWSQVIAMTERFLSDLWRDGALAGENPEQAFFVACGLGSTMTQPDIARRRLRVEIGFAPTRPAEFVLLRFRQKMAR